MAFQSKTDDPIKGFSVLPDVTTASVAQTANRATNESLFVSIKRLSSEKGRANWPLCLVFPKGRIEGVKAKRPVCPTLAPRFSLFQGLVSGELRLRPLAAGSID